MFEADEMEGCHSCKYGDEFDTEKEPCKYCYGLSLYTRKETKMEDIKLMFDEQIRLIHEDHDKFVFETIRTYTDGILAEGGIFKIPKKVLERAIICFKAEHQEEFEYLMKEGDEEGG